MKKRLGRHDFEGSTEEVAKRLLGCFLCHRIHGRIYRGRIVETEAYTQDAASHAANGKRTKRNAVMFGRPGLLYVYLTYGMHHCVNIVTEPEGTAGAVLLRGLDEIERANGPALLARALHLTRADNGRDLVRDPHIWVEPGFVRPEEKIVTSTRIGVRLAADLPLRFYLVGSPGVSKRDRRAEQDLARP
ncbi:MAG: DNA-3-methyladenine glycosylase [Candidatus Binatia bacterium]|nr:DNA-3-methyladenine glycosylase [Candidatus Binatia bacterium]